MYLAILATVLVMALWPARQKIFLDTACIPQASETAKRDGILSLGYFLRNTNTLLVLWDKTYFTRLWCVFEFAANVKLQMCGHDTRLKVEPSRYGPMVLAIFAFDVFEASFGIGQPIANSQLHESAVDMVAYTVLAVAMVFLAVAMGNHVEEIAEQTRQLKTFSFREARCFCCTVGHVHPETGDGLECDRRLIQLAVTMWFGSIENFDRFVREEIQEHTQIGARLPYHYMVFAFLPQIWLGLGSGVWLIRSGELHDGLDVLQEMIMRATVIGPLCCSLLWKILSWVHEAFGGRILHKLVASVACAAMYGLLVLIFNVVSVEGKIILMLAGGVVVAVDYRQRL